METTDDNIPQLKRYAKQLEAARREIARRRARQERAREIAKYKARLERAGWNPRVREVAICQECSDQFYRAAMSKKVLCDRCRDRHYKRRREAEFQIVMQRLEERGLIPRRTDCVTRTQTGD
jgi:hypothetical protein